MGKTILFNDGWEFTKQEIGQNVDRILKEDIVWELVDIPHDWLIYDTTGFHDSGEGWYRKSFSIDSSKTGSLGAKPKELSRYILRFEGVYMDSTVYVNGVKVYEWKYGYSTFECDMTDALKDGENTVLVKVVLQTPNSRWYSGAGIYRNVNLKVVPLCHFSSDGIYISTRREEAGWKVLVESEIEDSNEHNRSLLTEDKSGMEREQYSIKHTLYDGNGKVIAMSEGSNSQEMMVLSPLLWDINSPNLYVVKSELMKGGFAIDEEYSRFGFRSIRFDQNSGFYLNERSVKLHGVCLHHDLGALGTAVNRSAIRRQLTLLREMGVNAIRTSHNMCALELVELADEMGFLVQSESFDMWEKPKNSYDYARFFKEWASKDIASWIRRDRNHPSVIMWCIGNEINDTHAGSRGEELTKMLMNQVHNHDPRHNAYVTIGSNYMPWENAQKCADIVKLAGYNYGEKYYEAHHKEHPDWIIYGSETGSVVQSRGIYHFPLHTEILCDDDEQCSSLGNSITSWGARSIEKCITDDRDAEFSAGMFIWSGFDYIGEPTPYHTKNSYFGQLDTAGFKKDSFYIYQAEWTDYKEAPMIHLFPYWDFNEGQLIDVRVCSNAPAVELFFNHISMGRVEIDHKHGKKLLGEWRIPYQKGELHAVAYDENNNIIAEDTQRSFEDSAKIVLKADKEVVDADGRELIFVEISTEDKYGNPVHNAKDRVNVKVSGAGRLIGLDNGDSTDYDSYKGTSRRLFSGKLLAIIAAKTVPGEINIEVSGMTLPCTKLSIFSKECDHLAGVSAQEENIQSELNREVPIRKLEIVSLKGNHLDQKLKELEVEVKVLPEQATYEDLTWRVTNASGVDTNIARITPNRKRARIQAIGDGEFYVRVAANNGAQKPRIVSSLDFEISGLGKAYINPYEFVAGSLYCKAMGEVTSGNERGVATPREGESIVVFDRLDFGEIGSDEITIPIFELDNQPTRIEIWEGIPYEPGSEKLADVIYDKKSIWNTYQKESYHLSRRVKGIAVISFLLRKKVHIKGFSFKEYEKAYERLSICDYNMIYGDNYEVYQDYIGNIGNNVTISFEHMDFGADGIKSLTICGRCHIKNSVLVCFKNGESEVRQMIEFERTEDFTEQVFEMKKITDLKTVSFLFLPGCKFDLKWFHFHK